MLKSTRSRDRNAAYVAASTAQARDALPRGGLKKGSGHHYERCYESDSDPDAPLSDDTYSDSDDE